MPFVFPEEFLEQYPNDSVQLPPNMYAPDGMPAIAWQSWGETRNYADIKALGLSGAPNASDGGMPPAKTLELRRAYYSAVSFTDDNIGNLLAHMDALGITNDTLVVFHAGTLCSSLLANTLSQRAPSTLLSSTTRLPSLPLVPGCMCAF